MQMSEPRWNKVSYLEAISCSLPISPEELWDVRGCHAPHQPSITSTTKQGISIWTIKKKEDWPQIARCIWRKLFQPVQMLTSCQTLLLLSHSVMSYSMTHWTTSCHASHSFTISQSLLKIMSIESLMLSSHLVLCCPLLLLPSILPSIRVFTNESVLHIR